MKKLILFLLLSASALAQCGDERWSVKTLADKDASKVEGSVVKTTVHELVKLTPPAKWSNTLPRIKGVETTIYKVQALLIGLKLESDQDYHLVLADPVDRSVTMIAEIPSPKCAKSIDSATKLRAMIDKIAKPTTKFKKLDKPVSITFTGVGFFDKPHGQDGLAPNAIELHPVLGIAN